LRIVPSQLHGSVSQLHGWVSVVCDSVFSVSEPVVMVGDPASSVVTVDGDGGDDGGGNTGP
jgi:hypothetical protein